jgi:hypothetical protein
MIFETGPGLGHLYGDPRRTGVEESGGRQHSESSIIRVPHRSGEIRFSFSFSQLPSSRITCPLYRTETHFRSGSLPYLEGRVWVWKESIFYDQS